ncbi:MAG: S-adenosyl-l-methionine hydroxide adenosyltransferase family protein [Magnetospirillum sp.]
MTRPVFIFTDFGVSGPYVGQMHAALLKAGVTLDVVNLMADAPSFDPQSSAYLLAALLPHTSNDAVLLGVVDPGVGSQRQPLIVEADGRFLVGPDNGLFALAVRQVKTWRAWTMTWRPETLSASFHGRDLFAPVAAALARGQDPAGYGKPQQALIGQDWPDDLPHVIYVDHYGNAITGIKGDVIETDRVFDLGGRRIPWANTFSDVGHGQAFWYVNSIGLVEISVNCGSAGRDLNLEIGSFVG